MKRQLCGWNLRRSRGASAAYERRMVERAEHEADYGAEARGSRSEIEAERERVRTAMQSIPGQSDGPPLGRN